MRGAILLHPREAFVDGYTPEGARSGRASGRRYTLRRMRALWVALALASTAGLLGVAAAGKHPRPPAPGKQVKAPPGKQVKAPPGKQVKAARTDGAVTADMIARYAEGARLFAAGDYAAAQQQLEPLADAPLASRDTLLYMLATSEASQVPPIAERAIRHFIAIDSQSRYKAIALARSADLAFDLGQFARAKAAYTLVLESPAGELDPAVARFRLAEIAEREGRRSDALAGWRRVFVEHPAHPLADRALERIRAALPARQPAAQPTAEERIERARRLVAEHGWERALVELAAITTDGLPANVRDEIDYQVGMTHFKMRHGYDIAAQKLLGVWPRLASARQPDALFHGARAWSRVDQDDRAIDGYKLVVEKFPSSKQAKEAHFLIGWLEFNRGRYAAALPTLEKVVRQDRSSFSDDAAWFAAYSKWLLGDATGALAGLDEYDRLASGKLGDGKARYWKARALDKLGRRPEAVAVYKAVVDAFPFSYYAQQSRVRLREAGVRVGPFGSGPSSTPMTPLAALDTPAARAAAADPRMARVDELLRIGMRVEAAVELDHFDKALMKDRGAAGALPVLFDRYLSAEDFFHVHRLAEAYGGSALRRDPRLDPVARRWWELVYPLAYQRFVEKYGPTGHNPTYYLYTIMQKESAYNPHDLSYADAIGLLQMIPPTSRRVGERIGRPYTDDVLYDPEGNIQFGPGTSATSSRSSKDRWPSAPARSTRGPGR